MSRPGSASLQELLGQRPQYAAALDDVEAALWSQDACPAIVLELCRLRIAQLLGCQAALHHRTPAAIAAGLDEAMAADVAHWPTEGRFDGPARTCLGYAEQLLLDAQGVSDGQAAAVIDAVGEGGFLVLTYACGFFETTQRAHLLVGAAQW